MVPRSTAHLAIAHSSPPGGGNPQYLATHLMNVGCKGTKRLDEVGCRDPLVRDLVWDSGLSHDIGKANTPFLNYVSADANLSAKWWTPHAAYSTLALAQLLTEGQTEQQAKATLASYLHLLYLVHHHHAGFKVPEKVFLDFLYAFVPYFTSSLPPDPNFVVWQTKQDWDRHKGPVGKGSHRVVNGTKPIYYEDILYQTTKFFRGRNFELPVPREFPVLSSKAPAEDHFRTFVQVRAAMGALTHGDCVDTGHFYGTKLVKLAPLVDTLTKVQVHQGNLVAEATRRGTSKEIMHLRNVVFNACSIPASASSKFYLLASPTGSAKTIGAMAFAGAIGAKQIIYAPPFLSIVDQVVKDFQDSGLHTDILPHVSVTMSDEAVNDTGELGTTYYRNPKDKISPKQDWLHPLIVSTIERVSRVLLGKSKSDARRLLALYYKDALLVVDEAHTIPPHKLYAYLQVLQHLGCRVLLMTATSASTRLVLDGIGIQYTDLVPASALPVMPSLRTWRLVKSGPTGPDFEQHDQVLSIYDTKWWAHSSFERVRGLEHAYLITTNLCPQHRRKMLAEVRTRLDPANPQPCIVVSTQTIEAGTDLDCPVVYRMASPLVSVIQAGGRCNRGGSRQGAVTVWEPPLPLWNKQGVPACAPDADYYIRALAMLREWKVLFGQGTLISDAELLSMELAVTQEEMASFGGRLKTVDHLIRERQYGPDGIDDLCLIPRDELVAAIVNYEDALRRVESGDMYRSEMDRYTIEMKGPEDRQDGLVTKKPITLKGETEQTWVYIYLGSYDQKVGIGHPDLP